MSETHAQFIDVDELCIGMYIYLDLGWIDHPFALNNFKIISESQIETIRELGVKRLRWSPEKSDRPSPATHPTTPAISAESTPASHLSERRKLLNHQSSNLEQCDRGFYEATRGFRELQRLLLTQTETSRGLATNLVNNLINNFLQQSDSCIRLLSEKAGEQSALHAINVTILSLLLGKTLGMETGMLQSLGIGALLHDVGKVALPERLRWREEGLSAAEQTLSQQHVVHGVTLATRMKLPPEVCVIIAQHHEYADGTGFPARITGENLTLASRIVSLVNQYDNLCNPTNPAAALTPHNAISLLFAQSRKKFDAATLEVFIRMMGVYPPGSVVQLTDNSYALVVSVNPARPLKPRVIIHNPQVPREEALVVDLDSLPNLGIKLSLKPVQLPRAVFDYLSPRQRMCYFFERARDPAQPRVGV